MGLDITAHGNLQAVDRQETKKRYGAESLPDYYLEIPAKLNPPGMEAQATGLAPGFYLSFNSFRFRAGSYSGYSGWRDSLARFAGHIGAKAVWDDPRPGPFVDLINFSDCEGYIGAVAAARLAADFIEHRARAQGWDDIYWQSQYDRWLAACLIAARGGCIEFH